MRALLRRALGRHVYEGMDLGTCYPEPWLVAGHPGREFWWRFWLGRPMDGRRWSNATFWRCATSGEPSWWLRLAGWQRVALRLAGAHSALIVLPLLTLTVLSAWWPELRSPWLLGALIVSALPLLLPAGALTAHRLVRSRGLVLPWWERSPDSERGERSPDDEQNSERNGRQGSEREQDGERESSEHAGDGSERSRFYERWTYAPRTLIEGSREWERSVVLPLARVLAPQLGRAWHPRTAGQWCTVPRDYAQPDGSPVEIRVPGTFSGADRAAMARLVRTAATRLHLKELTARWELEGECPRVLLSAPVAPPELLTLADVRHFLEAAEEYRPFLGVAAGGAALYAEMVEDSPHIALSAGTGGGKTTLAALVAAQALDWDWQVVVLDWKQSPGWKPLINLPGVRYITETEDIHAFGEHLQGEIDTRKRFGLTGRSKLLIIRDEWNATAEVLMLYWQQLRAMADSEEKKSMPLKSPALVGFGQLDYAGREFGLHDFVIAQRLSARVFNGNTDMRECFGIRGMARFTDQTKKMLVGNMKPFPKRSNHPGRWVIVAGEDVSVVQVPLLSADELREVATCVRPGRETTGQVDSMQVNMLSHETTQSGRAQLTSGLPADRVRLAKLSTLAETLEPYGITQKVLQNERARDGSFPQAASGDQFSGYLYDVAEVTEWAKGRHARMIAERNAK